MSLLREMFVLSALSSNLFPFFLLVGALLLPSALSAGTKAPFLQPGNFDRHAALRVGTRTNSSVVNNSHTSTKSRVILPGPVGARATKAPGFHPNPPRWISQHPAVAQNQQYYSKSGFPRSHPMYWTLPSKSAYDGENTNSLTDARTQVAVLPNLKEKSLGGSSDKRNTSSQRTGAIEPSHGLSSLRLVQSIQKNEFTSSTPTKEPLQNSHKMNLGNGMSPILKENLFNSKSKMTAEEIFAAIHKSKKKLNIKDDLENRSESPGSSSLSPDGSECSLGNKSRERSSWSPNSFDLDKKANEARTRKSWIGASTPINSFKKLLLQQGIKNPASKELKLSAVEQLKLTKQESPGKAEIKTPPRMVLNSRSRASWRYASPRTDILSSTIPEDCNEVEKCDDSLKCQRGSLRIAQSQALDPGNLYAAPDLRDSKCEVSKPRENRSLEITKKYLQQARKNFFSEPLASNPMASPARKQLNFSGDKSPAGSGLAPFNNSINRGFVSPGERKKASFISLETAL